MGDNEPKARVFEITSQEPYLTEYKIIQGLAHKTIKEAVYILHDKDTYTDKTVGKERDRLYKAWTDIQKNDPLTKGVLSTKGIKTFEDFYIENHKETVGSVKPAHWHCYVRMDAPQTITTISKWFDTAKQNVEIKKGAGAWVDCCEYAVHDSESARNDGKYGYEWENLHVHNTTIDAVKEAVRDKQLRRLKYGKDLTDKEMLRMKVLNEGMSIAEAMEKYPLLYAEDKNTLAGLRMDYLASKGVIPTTRYNFFIQGSGGVGKDTVGRGLAREFFPGKSDEEIFHIVKDYNVPFEGYDGQPVIIWEDARSQTLIQKFGRDGVFRMFDINVTRGRYNVKYGSVPLTNSINILTSVENYTSFLDNLAGEYVDKEGNKRKAEDKGQAYRRFPFIIPIMIDYMDILVQKAFLSGEAKNYEEYVQYQRVKGNLARLMWDDKIKKLTENERKNVQSRIEKRFMQNEGIQSMISLVENNQGLFDKSLNVFNEVLEAMMSEMDKLEDKESTPEQDGYMQLSVSDLENMPEGWGD